MTNKIVKGFLAFTTILATATCAFATVTNEKTLSNVNWNQTSPWENYLPKGETENVSAGCVPTAYSQFMAYHEWPAIIDDTVIGHAAIGVDSGTYIYRQDFNTPVYNAIDWNAMKTSSQSTRGSFECGRLLAIVGAYSFPVYTVGATASTVSCPHFNPWYGDFSYYNNPLEGEENWEAKRKALFAAIKESIDAKLLLCAGFHSSQGPHAIVVQGYRENNDVPEAYCNLGWGGSSNGWSSYSTNPTGKNYSLTGVYAMHAPRKMVQIEQLPAVSPNSISLKWYAPKYWKELAPEGKRITGYQVEIAALNPSATDWTDDFSALKQDYLLKSMCDGGATTEGGVTHLKDVIKVENNELWMYNCPDPRYYEWPETWVATGSSKLDFNALIEYTENMDGLLQIKVANQPWETLVDLTDGGKRDKSPGEWKDYSVSLSAYSGKAFKLRLYVARRQRGEYNHWSWKFRNWKLSSVKTFVSTGNPSKVNGVSSSTFSTLQVSGTYEFAVKPVFANGEVGKCFRTVTTTVGSAFAANTIDVTYRGESPEEGLSFDCALANPCVFNVTTTREIVALKAISGNLAIYPEDAITVKQLSENTWTVTLTPTDTFTTYKKYSSGQKLLLTLAAIDANGTAVYKDLSLTFDTRNNDRIDSGTGGNGTFAKSDFYLPEAADDEWVATVGDALETEYWGDMTFTCGSESRKGNQLPSNAKVRFEVTATARTTSWVGYRRIKIDADYQLATVSVVSKDGGNQPLGFAYDASHIVRPSKLNVQGVTVYLAEPCFKPRSIWIGWQGRVEAQPVFLELCEDLTGVGTISLMQKDSMSIADTIDLDNFKGYVTGAETLTPAVTPDPSLIKDDEGGGECDSGGSDSGNSGTIIDSNATDPVDSIYRTYGYDMSENYYDARKQAIQTGKVLFVLSGSTSCNYCNMAKTYMQERARIIDKQFVVYYAKLQNNGGKSPMQGGLPQYGTFDPRTIDAFTGTKQADGTFNPGAAWYSGHNNAFYSERGYGEVQMGRVIDAGSNKTMGKFTKFTLEGPSRIFAKTATKYHLYAHFDDGVKMEIDHGVEWLVEGDASVDTEGYLTVRTGSVSLSARNAFYNLGAEENKLTMDVSVVEASELKSIEIDTTPYNLEDDPQVFLKAKAHLKDGSTTEILPQWTVQIKNFIELPDGAPIAERKDIAVQMSQAETGEVIYLHEDNKYYGINGQDHILHVTASAGGQTAAADITVYGPSRLWVSDWDIVSGNTVALGSVVKANVKEIKYTYKGEIITTSDLKYADFEISAYMMGQYNIVNESCAGTMFAVNDRFNTSGSRFQIRLGARRKGGKYTGIADHVWRGSQIDERVLTIKSPTSTYLTSKNGIKVNSAWASIYFPGEAFTAALLERDDDNDGYTNDFEFLLGTNPKDKNDRWQFTACHFDWPDDIYYRVMFMNSQVPDRVYTIEGRETESSPWMELGKMKGEEPGVISEADVTLADKCHYFRVKASSDSFGEAVIPGLGVYVGTDGNEINVSITPGMGEVYPAFAVDANKTKYPIYVNITPTEDKTTPLFVMTTTEVEKGQLNRIVPSVSLAAEGWSLYYEKDESGLWANFYATKTATKITSWEEVKESTEFAAIPGLSPEAASVLKNAALVPTKLAEWALQNGQVTLGSDINLDCFLMNAANAESAPELKLDADDLKAILADDLDAIKAKYPNAKVEVEDVTKTVCGEGAQDVHLYRLELSF